MTLIMYTDVIDVLFFGSFQIMLKNIIIRFHTITAVIKRGTNQMLYYKKNFNSTFLSECYSDIESAIHNDKLLHYLKQYKIVFFTNIIFLIMCFIGLR